MPWAEKQILPQQEGFYEREIILYKLFLTFDSGYSKTISLAEYHGIQIDFLKYKFCFYHWLREHCRLTLL